MWKNENVIYFSHPTVPPNSCTWPSTQVQLLCSETREAVKKKKKSLKAVEPSGWHICSTTFVHRSEMVHFGRFWTILSCLFGRSSRLPLIKTLYCELAIAVVFLPRCLSKSSYRAGGTAGSGGGPGLPQHRELRGLLCVQHSEGDFQNPLGSHCKWPLQTHSTPILSLFLCECEMYIL